MKLHEKIPIQFSKNAASASALANELSKISVDSQTSFYWQGYREDPSLDPSSGLRLVGTSVGVLVNAGPSS